jgi:hypothetical protein
MKSMLSTENTLFELNKAGHLTVYLTSRTLLEGEAKRVLKMATMYARRKKIKKPVTWNKWWSGRYFVGVPILLDEVA